MGVSKPLARRSFDGCGNWELDLGTDQNPPPPQALNTEWTKAWYLTGKVERHGIMEPGRVSIPGECGSWLAS